MSAAVASDSLFRDVANDIDAASREHSQRIRRLIVTVPPLEIFLSRPREHVALHVLRANVMPGMSKAQTRAARQALRVVLASLPGGEGEEKMTPTKADRARDFFRNDFEIGYTIDRHPAQGPFGQTRQSRRISLLSGREWLASETLDRPTLDVAIELARAPRRRKPIDDITARGALRGVHHLRVLLRCRQVMTCSYDEHVEAIALAWVADVARDALLGAWRGAPEHVLRGTGDVALAEAVAKRARELWSEVLWAALP